MSFFFSHHPEFQEPVDRAREAFAVTGLLILTGASGTGKTHLAEQVHRHCPQADQPLVTQDAAGLAETRVESQLFGHARGAFSGAASAYAGLVGAVGAGTLVLETIEDLSLGTQAHLLRFLQERRYRPVGAVHEQAYGGRIILTSRFPLARLKEKGLVRDDFYFRIAAGELHLPPLARRPDDFPMLCRNLAERLTAIMPPGVRPLDDDAVDQLARRTYPGNLHGLRNLLQQAMLRDISPTDLPEDPFETDAAELPRTGSLKGDLAVLERRLLDRALREYALPRAELAAVLGISRRALIYKLREHGLIEGH